MPRRTLEYGDRCIIQHSDRYKNRHEGKMCSIRSTGYTDIAVQIDDVANPASKYGYFYYPRKHLQYIKGDETTMSKSNVIKGNYTTVIAQFTNSTTQIACANFGEKLAVGDWVVVKTAHHGFAVCEITAVDVETIPCEREIVCPIDFNDYFQRVEKRKRAEEIKKKLDERTAELQQLQVYELLAKGDASLSALLEEFKELMDLC